nr:hypothetical protein [Tanacetum cinerariifolium]
APLSPVYAPEYPKYLAPSDDDISLAKDQPLPALLITLSPGYIADSEPIEDGPKEDLDMDLIDYVAEEEDEEESFTDEEEEHLARVDSALSARIADYAATPTPPSPPPSPLSPLSSPLLLIPSPPLPLPSPDRRGVILEADKETARALECQDGYEDACSCYNRSSVNGDDNHNSRSGGRRPVPTARVCTYKDFLNCQPLNLKGTKGVIRLNQWSKKMESVFHISSCTVENQVKYATCTLLRNALTWWNSHVNTVGHDASYGMLWKTLMKIMTD